MIQLPDSETISDTLGQFLSDETTCFLGTGMSKIVSELGSLSYYSQHTGFTAVYSQSVNFKTGVEVGFLAC